MRKTEYERTPSTGADGVPWCSGGLSFSSSRSVVTTVFPQVLPEETDLWLSTQASNEALAICVCRIRICPPLYIGPSWPWVNPNLHTPIAPTIALERVDPGNGITHHYRGHPLFVRKPCHREEQGKERPLYRMAAPQIILRKPPHLAYGQGGLARRRICVKLRF